jgi:hypothetical protein
VQPNQPSAPKAPTETAGIQSSSFGCEREARAKDGSPRLVGGDRGVGGGRIGVIRTTGRRCLYCLVTREGSRRAVHGHTQVNCSPVDGRRAVSPHARRSGALVHRFSPFTSLQALYISMQSLLPSRGCRSRWPPAVAAPPVEGGGATGTSATSVVGADSGGAFGESFAQPTDR